MYKQIVKPTLVLVIICVIVSLLLSFTYNKAGIAELGNSIDEAKLDEIKNDVIPNSQKIIKSKIESENPNVIGIYEDDNKNAIAIHLTTKGYGGEMKMLVGIAKDGSFIGAKVLDTKETPNIGTKTEDKSFADKFIGKKDNVAIKKDGGEIDQIAGATVSSRGYTAGVNIAFEVYNEVKGEIQ